MQIQKESKREPIVLNAGEGRTYPMGRISAVFKADGNETKGKYNISEWWLEPNCKGPGAHSHDAADCIFFVIEGTMTILVGDKWIDAKQGAFILVPGGVMHDFENRSSKRAGVLNLSTPGTFEKEMPAIADWFAKNPPPNAI